MIIVQISDMHCADAEQFLRDKLTRAINEINALNPDLIIVAGDLTDHGFKTEFEEAKRFIDQIPCRQKIITLGNHDSQYTGYMLFEELFGASSGMLDTPECRVIYVNTARPDRDEGRVGRDQIKFIEGLLQLGKFICRVNHYYT